MQFNRLKAMEDRLQQFIDDRPDAASVRINLAWCQILRMVFHAGEEHALNRLSTEDASLAERLEQRKSELAAIQPRLIRSSLDHATLAPLISKKPSVQLEAKKVQAIVYLAGDVVAVKSSRDKLLRSLAVLVSDLQNPASDGLDERSAKSE